jgi:hypothetical protein
LSSELLPSGESFLEGTANNWYAILQEALTDPSASGLDSKSFSADNGNLVALQSDLSAYLKFGGLSTDILDYDPATQVLTVAGPLVTSSQNLQSILETGSVWLPVCVDGIPKLDSSGHIVTEEVTWLPQNTTTYTDPDFAPIDALASNSALKPPLGNNGALIVGGTGSFDITAGFINLGNALGILSVGNGGTLKSPLLAPGLVYSYLMPYIASAPGATINIVTSTLDMPSSTVAALGGGDVNIICTGTLAPSEQDPLNNNGVGVSLDLGSPDLAAFEGEIMTANNLGLGVYTAGGGTVNLTALGTINVDTSTVGAFNGGDINITSLTGDVNAGSSGTTSIPIYSFPANATLPIEPYESVYGNGIVADTLIPESSTTLVPGAAAQPGNITVITPQGSIYADLGGILQESLGTTLQSGPYILLEAGTPAGGDWNSKATPVYVGNVELGNSGAIGGSVTVKATGTVSGLLISAQNANVTSQVVGSLTVLAAGTATVSSQSGTGGITIIGGQGVTANGIGNATLLGQNVSANGNAAQSTLGSSAASTSASTSAAGQTSGAAQQQVASNSNDDDKKKKKNGVLRTIGRVTIILNSAS